MEQPLLPNEACTLGSINLRDMIKINSEGKLEVDFCKLRNTVRLATRFLDNVLDVTTYPIKEIGEMARKYRKIGLGVMGWAHMLYLLKIPYNSQKAIDLAETIMRVVQRESHIMSEELALDRGSFPGISNSIYKGRIMRNATTTTLAPTGSLSIIASTSGGIEPEFALAYIRNSADEELDYVNSIFEEAFIAQTGYAQENEIYKNVMKAVAKKGTVHGISDIPNEIEKVFVTAHDVEVEWHVKMQATFQKFTCNGVSKTINMSHNATEDDVEKAYILARESGCKGITIYRDGSRENQTLMVGSKKETPIVNVEVKNELLSQDTTLPRIRPDITTGYTEKVKIGCGNLYITVNEDEKGICEVFTNTGRAGGCPSQSEATARLISVALRSGVSVPEIIDQLKGIRCPSTIRQKGLSVTSCPDAIGRFLEKIYKKEPLITIKSDAICTEPHLKTCGDCSKLETCPNTQMTTDSQLKHLQREGITDDSKFATHCPECGKKVEHEGGCVTCRHCGWGKCG